MIGMNLKYLRKKYGYSQEDLAERLEVSRQSVAKWENEVSQDRKSTRLNSSHNA